MSNKSDWTNPIFCRKKSKLFPSPFPGAKLSLGVNNTQNSLIIAHRRTKIYPINRREGTAVKRRKHVGWRVPARLGASAVAAAVDGYDSSKPPTWWISSSTERRRPRHSTTHSAACFRSSSRPRLATRGATPQVRRPTPHGVLETDIGFAFYAPAAEHASR